MRKNQKLFLALGSLFVLLGATLPLQPQVLRKKNLPVTAEPAVTTRKPTDQVTAEQPAATTRRPNDDVIAEPRARTRRRTDEIIARPPEPEIHVFEKPRYMDDRLDWCLNWGFNCGEPAARKFCHRRRYEDVKAFEPEVVGQSEQTRLMGSDQVCNADFCTSFSYITCSGPIWHNRVFQNPKWNEERLDACLMPGGYCGGRQAADKFCGSEGFMDALDFTLDREPDRNKTRFSATNAICERGCRGFQEIICRDPINR